MLHSLSLHHFRSYRDETVNLSPRVTIISGPNGSGKTNILEALYVACRGSSFRGSDQELLQYGQDWWRLNLQHDDTERAVQFDSQKTSARKQFVINGVKRSRLSAQFKLPVVLFEPNDLRLLEGSPARRRSFIDSFISQLEPGYSVQLSRYERSLKQRNNLLKSAHAAPDELFVWDMTLSEAGAHILKRRTDYTHLLNQMLSATYQSISCTKDTVTIDYRSFDANQQSSIQQTLLYELHKSHKKDILLGYTTVGPHRDDLLFKLNSTPAGSVASRGETRSIVLSLKLIEIDQLTAQQAQPPLLLLDDVFSELDSVRRQAIIARNKTTQTIITTTDADTIASNFKGDYKVIKRT